MRKIEFYTVEELFENEDFCQGFCADCGAITFLPATLQEPEEYDCPASFEPWCEKCWRHRDYKDIEKIIDGVNVELTSYLNN